MLNSRHFELIAANFVDSQLDGIALMCFHKEYIVHGNPKGTIL